MSDLDELEPEDEQAERTVTLRRDQIKVLQDQAKKAPEAEALAARLQQENSVLKALQGKELSDKQMKALVAAHDGDWDTDAVRATAQELGFVPAPEAPPPADTSGDAGVLGRMADAAATGTPADSTSQAAYEAEVAATRNEAELYAVMAKYGKPVSTSGVG